MIFFIDFSWKPSENPWKPSENPWKPLKTFENPWKPLKTIWKPSENHWKPSLPDLVFRGFQVVFRGFQMVFRGFQGFSKVFPENLWKPGLGGKGERGKGRGKGKGREGGRSTSMLQNQAAGQLSCKLIFAFSRLKPQTSTFQFSNLKPHKAQKSQISKL